ncbi:glutamate ABC transporter substrate-binding protein [Solihabitans fulvus]|uniref:Glutamate ABC transporter substrate-binding protein n=1 Tax=Solihabitans fulvus TaxID=1892852 RepID=A0A5B2XT36_9PSEU|nr:glutamate ABC transporter substrate-binding protein [Solihabitans fulvus]KAA2266523.1 glutamate ABC transporter substrate-binding protein [Solihabitans fulvus]
MISSRALRVCGVLAAIALLGACGSGSASPNDSLVRRASAFHKLTIGIAYDVPGIGLKRVDGKVVGFDIDVARFIANELGVQDRDITWREAEPSERENLIRSNAVDLVVEAYSITDERRKLISLVGPYFVAGQSLLVRLTDNDITGPDHLNGHKLCSVTGSTSAEEVRDKYAQGTQLVEYNRFSDCVTALLGGQVDALTTDDVVLAGYAAQNPELLKVVGKPFTKELYGIGLRLGDADGKTAIAAALRKMIDSGAWKRSLEANIGPSDYPIPSPPVLDGK